MPQIGSAHAAEQVNLELCSHQQAGGGTANDANTEHKVFLGEECLMWSVTDAYFVEKN